MLSPQAAGDQIELTNDDGDKSIPLSDEIRTVLVNPDILMDEFKRALQSYCLETNRDWAMILKDECPDDTAYRQLRVRLRTFEM